MTENLRFIGTSTPEFQQGQVYPMLFGIEQGFLLVRLVGRAPLRYASLAMLLKFWQPASTSFATLAPEAEALATHGMVG